MRSLKTLVCTVVAGWLLSVCALAQQDVISTIIGGGPNNIPALHANLYSPYGVTVDGTGNVYITSYNQNRVFKVNTSGTLTVFAGSGALGFTGDGVTGGAGNASLSHPFGTAIDASGNVYIADFSNCGRSIGAHLPWCWKS